MHPSKNRTQDFLAFINILININKFLVNRFLLFVQVFLELNVKRSFTMSIWFVS